MTIHFPFITGLIYDLGMASFNNSSNKSLSNDSDSNSDSSKPDDELFSLSHQNTPVTPFNLCEELEEGYFDCDGNYHWMKRHCDDDNWLNNIDWNTKIKSKFNEVSVIHNSEPDLTKSYDEVYKEIIQYLKPRETVAKALSRLGKHRLSTKERLNLKKQGVDLSHIHDCTKKVTSLTGLANYILNKTGNIDIYQETYESLLKRIHIHKDLI